jgi:oxygen-independent coproporphyrinogen III oxidase
MRKDLADKYDLRVPRYTSYPTAPHFNDGVDAGTYRQWLGELDGGLDLSLYFHIPFCDSMCWFCGCYTKIVNRYEPIRDYLEVLLAEVDLVADALPGRYAARHAHWGGGSPTMLTGEDWRRIIDKLRTRFDTETTTEFAVELDPRDTTEEYVAALASAGVNRTSIGVQDFHPEVQQAINRIQPFDVTERVVGWLRDHGIERLNMDLMYGLPHQTVERVVDQVDLAVRLAPNRVALFGYAHVPWMKSHQKIIDEATLPDAAERWAQFEAASARLVEHGYVAIGLDHFSHPDDDLAAALGEGRLHRNFQGYTTDTAPALLGFGASAIGSLPQGYVQNTSPLKAYRETVTGGEFPISRGFALTPEDRLRSAVIERLMCDLSVDLDAERHRIDTGTFNFDSEMSRLEPLSEDGIVTVTGNRISITTDGRPFVRLVAAVFDSYLNVGEKRHSRAV